jgi:polyhydroxyalkanoate synthesis regulator phasin
MTISNLSDNTVYDQKIADIASRYGISNQTIEDLLRCRHELDSSVLQNKFDQICNDMANYIAINVNQDLTHVTEQIQGLIDRLQQQGKSPEEAQEKVAQDIATQAQNDPTAKEKLVKWGQSIGTATVTDVVKGAVKLAIRLAGIPIP